MAPQNPENNPALVVIDLGSPNADVLLPLMRVLRKVKVLRAVLMSGGAVPGTPTDKVVMQLKSGATVIASYDTENGAMVANVGVDMVLVAAELVRAKDEDLTLDYNETDSGSAVALTNAKLILHLAQIGSA